MILKANDICHLKTALGDRGLTIPGRTEGRTALDREVFCLRRYLLTLATNNRLPFPLEITKSETPDFIVTGSESFGIEITEATDENDQREYTLAERSGRRFWRNGEFGGRGLGGFAGNTPEILWCRYLSKAVQRKAQLKFEVPNIRLLVYSNSNAGGFIRADRVDKLLVEAPPDADRFSEISIIQGDYLIFNAFGSRELLRIVE